MTKQTQSTVHNSSSLRLSAAVTRQMSLYSIAHHGTVYNVKHVSDSVKQLSAYIAYSVFVAVFVKFMLLLVMFLLQT